MSRSPVLQPLVQAQEVLGTAIFAALAVLGVKRSPWFLAI
jgi:hypothetical protein